MKEFLKKLIERKEQEAKNLRQKIQGAQTADEVRALGDTLNAVLEELQDAKEQLDELDDDGGNGSGNGDDGGTSGGAAGEGRSAFNPAAAVAPPTRVASGMMNNGRRNQEEDPYATMEYRQAFKRYVQRGTPIPAELRAGGDKGTTLAADIGAIIPTTVMNELIKEVSKVYGQIYTKVRKLNVPGGVEFPISKLAANFKWINDGEVSDRQKAGEIKDKVTFSYHIGEIRISESLLTSVVSLDIFESEIAKLLVEAYVKAMDTAIISGTGTGQPLGITKDPRVTGNTGNIIEFTETDIADWTAWRKNLFAKVPLSKRGQGEFLFPSSTVESNLLTMKDKNDRPLFREATEGAVGNLAGTFFGREIMLVEPDIVKDFDTAINGDIIGIFWVPTDYAINTNLQFGMKRYFDEDTNEWVNKGLTIVDGKILDVSGCYLLKKKVE